MTLETLAEFHIRYELIHPFQDGNGRTGILTEDGVIVARYFVYKYIFFGVSNSF